MTTNRTAQCRKISFFLLVVILAAVFLYATVPTKYVVPTIHHSPTKSRPHPIYKPTPSPAKPIVDNFPLAAKARSPTDLPPIPSWNTPPSPHVQEGTPLLIGFTRNWLLLQQTVVSYITAGWPPEDIYVIEDTGTMNANRNGKLTLQNPFYLDYRRLTEVFGVNVISTPTLLTFAQLQNFFLYTAISKNWTHYFWSHMDAVALSREDWDDVDDVDGDYKSLYMRCVEDLRNTLKSGYLVDGQGHNGTWAIRFYAYDRLALVNRHAFEAVGGWDTMIPFYGTDCDMHERLTMAGLIQADGHVGLVYDVGSTLSDLQRLYRKRASSDLLTEDDMGSQEWKKLRDRLNSISVDKNTGIDHRNTWQASQTGGQGEPYYRDSAGFQKAIDMWMGFGQKIMAEKWGHRGCNLRGVGLGAGDPWRVEHDWGD